MNNIFTYTLSGISILISIIALIHTMKSSYNPKIKIEPLMDNDTNSIKHVFNLLNKKLYELIPEPKNRVIIFFVIIPAIILFIIETIKEKK